MFAVSVQSGHRQSGPLLPFQSGCSQLQSCAHHCCLFTSLYSSYLLFPTRHFCLSAHLPSVSLLCLTLLSSAAYPHNLRATRFNTSPLLPLYFIPLRYLPLPTLPGLSDTALPYLSNHLLSTTAIDRHATLVHYGADTAKPHFSVLLRANTYHDCLYSPRLAFTVGADVFRYCRSGEIRSDSDHFFPLLPLRLHAFALSSFPVLCCRLASSYAKSA